MAMADRVTRKAPKRGFAHVVKANVLYRQNKKEAAENELKTAVNQPESSPYQQAVALNKYGRFYASVGKYGKARELYDQAVTVDPYFVEATSNKGMSYQREGQWDRPWPPTARHPTLTRPMPLRRCWLIKPGR